MFSLYSRNMNPKEESVRQVSTDVLNHRCVDVFPDGSMEITE
jgi:hypothetical protein